MDSENAIDDSEHVQEFQLVIEIADSDRVQEFEPVTAIADHVQELESETALMLNPLQHTASFAVLIEMFEMFEMSFGHSV